MRSSIFCLVFLLVIIKIVEPKVFVLALTDPGSEENVHINLNQKNPRSNKFRKVILGKSENAYLNSPDNCLLSLETTKAQKLECLALFNNEKRSVEPDSYTPEFHHEYYTQRPKRTIYSMYNYYGGLLKTKPLFKDLTRQEFSQDYLDINDLSRSQTRCEYPGCEDQNYLLTQLPNTKSAIIKVNKRRVFDDVMQRSRSDSSDSSDSEKEEKENVRNRKKKHRKPNRFQVVFNEDASRESDEEDIINQSSKEQMSSSEEHTTKKPSSKKRKRKIVNTDSDSFEAKPKEKYAYLQGNKAIYDFRKRLQHFLPKRFHWEEKDMNNLGYYWYDGPIGKYTQ